LGGVGKKELGVVETDARGVTQRGPQKRSRHAPDLSLNEGGKELIEGGVAKARLDGKGRWKSGGGGALVAKKQGSGLPKR